MGATVFNHGLPGRPWINTVAPILYIENWIEPCPQSTRYSFALTVQLCSIVVIAVVINAKPPRQAKKMNFLNNVIIPIVYLYTTRIHVKYEFNIRVIIDICECRSHKSLGGFILTYLNH